jgi:arylamine N-acetyltransferase
MPTYLHPCRKGSDACLDCSHAVVARHCVDSTYIMDSQHQQMLFAPISIANSAWRAAGGVAAQASDGRTGYIP